MRQYLSFARVKHFLFFLYFVFGGRVVAIDESRISKYFEEYFELHEILYKMYSASSPEYLWSNLMLFFSKYGV